MPPTSVLQNCLTVSYLPSPLGGGTIMVGEGNFPGLFYSSTGLLKNNWYVSVPLVTATNSQPSLLLLFNVASSPYRVGEGLRLTSSNSCSNFMTCQLYAASPEFPAQAPRPLLFDVLPPPNTILNVPTAFRAFPRMSPTNSFAERASPTPIFF